MPILNTNAFTNQVCSSGETNCRQQQGSNWKTTRNRVRKKQSSQINSILKRIIITCIYSMTKHTKSTFLFMWYTLRQKLIHFIITLILWWGTLHIEDRNSIWTISHKWELVNEFWFAHNVGSVVNEVCSPTNVPQKGKTMKNAGKLNKKGKAVVSAECATKPWRGHLFSLETDPMHPRRRGGR